MSLKTHVAKTLVPKALLKACYKEVVNTCSKHLGAQGSFESTPQGHCTNESSKNPDAPGSIANAI